ncbi:MAG TPA: helix-turn-helix transcriptional regulator [Steroidobacteraceae bacterium]|jgi:AraC-like DNA-binding protein|nr:helix-turn-helix transcriptional regulator [Steroidobacteraceae bacterium]
MELAHQSRAQPHGITGQRGVLRAKAVAFVETNLADPDLGVTSIAADLGVSTRYVQLLFAELLTTPSSFIRARRLETAADLLRQRGATACITDIAFDVGFGDLSGFCHAFRRRFGVTPSDFRAGVRLPSD